MSKFYRYRKKIKYKQIRFKLTEKQYATLDAYCFSKKISSTKAIKQILLTYLNEHKKNSIVKQQINNISKKNIVSKNQLNLFDLIEAERSSSSNSF